MCGIFILELQQTKYTIHIMSRACTKKYMFFLILVFSSLILIILIFSNLKQLQIHKYKYNCSLVKCVILIYHESDFVGLNVILIQNKNVF